MLKEITVSNLKLNCSCVNVLISNSRLLGTKLVPHSSHTSLSIGLPYNMLTASASAMDQPKSNNLSMTDDGISVDTNGQPRFYDINKSGDQPRQIAKI